MITFTLQILFGDQFSHKQLVLVKTPVFLQGFFIYLLRALPAAARRGKRYAAMVSRSGR
jgi:hypothetical protein